MTRTRRLIVAILCLALVLASSLLVVSACKDKEEGFSVTVAEYNKEQGTVSVSKPAEGELYDDGEQVTVTVTPASDYQVESFKVNDKVQTLSGTTYTFAIHEDSTVAVTFSQKQTTPPPVKYKVTLSADNHSTLSISPESADGTYESGTTVTVTVTLDAGFVVQSFKVGGTEQELTNNAFSFKVEAATTVSVVTDRPITAAVLNTANGNVRYDGVETDSSLFKGDEEPSVSTRTLVNVFDNTNSLIWTTTQEDVYNHYLDAYLYGKADDAGHLAYFWHESDGTVKMYDGKNSAGTYDDERFFANYINPFSELTPEDFAYVEDDEWELVDFSGAKLDKVFLSLLHFHADDEAPDVVSFRVTVENDKITKVVIETAPVESEYYFDTYTYEFTLSQHGTASIPTEWSKSYTQGADQKKLADALTAAAGASAFKVHFVDNSEEGKVEYDIFRSANIAWFAVDGAPFGYVAREVTGGSAWEFSYDKDGNVVLGSQVADSFAKAVPSFDLGGISSTLFELKDGKFVLRECDIVMQECSSVYYLDMFPGLAAGSFGFSANEETFPYASDISITLDVDGKLQKVEFSYIISYMGFSMGEGSVELTFDWTATTLPQGVEVDQNDIQGVVSPDYVGTWTDESGRRLVEVTVDGITVDGFEANELSGLLFGGYQFYARVSSCSLVKDGDELVLTQDGEEIRLHKRVAVWEVVGIDVTYSGKDAEGNEGTLVFGTNDIKFTLGETTYTFTADEVDISIDEYDLLSIELNGDDGYFTIRQYYDSFDRLVIGDYRVEVALVKEGVTSEANTDFVGSYTGSVSGTPYTVAVEADKVTITAGSGDQAKVTTISDLDCFLYDCLKVLVFSYDGHTTFLQQMDSGSFGRLRLYSTDSYGIDCVVAKADFVPSWSEYTGVWEAEGYKVEITADAVKVTIGTGAAVTATDVAFDDTDVMLKWTFKLGTVSYTLSQYNFDTLDKLRLTDGDEVDVVLLTEGYMPDLTEFEGEYFGYIPAVGENAKPTKVSVNITILGTISVTFGDGNAQQATDISYDVFVEESYDYYVVTRSISFKLGDVAYALYYTAPGLFELTDVNYEVDVYVGRMICPEETMTYSGTYEDYYYGESTLTVEFFSDGTAAIQAGDNEIVVAGVSMVQDDLVVFYFVDKFGYLYVMEQWNVDATQWFFYDYDGYSYEAILNEVVKAEESEYPWNDHVHVDPYSMYVHVPEDDPETPDYAVVFGGEYIMVMTPDFYIESAVVTDFSFDDETQQYVLTLAGKDDEEQDYNFKVFIVSKDKLLFVEGETKLELDFFSMTEEPTVEDDWSVVVGGTFENTYTVVVDIAAKTITISQGDNSVTVTDAVLWNSHENGIIVDYKFVFVVNGVEYTLSYSDQETLVFESSNGSVLDGSLQKKAEQQEPTLEWSDLIGTWTGTNDNGETVTVVVEDGAITITNGEDEFPALNPSIFDNKVTFYWGGDDCELYFNSNGNLVFKNLNFNYEVECTQGSATTVDLSQFVGAYNGSWRHYNGSENVTDPVQIEVTADGLTLKIGDGQATAATNITVLPAADGFGPEISFTIDGNKYVFLQFYEDDDSEWSLSCSQIELNATLTKAVIGDCEWAQFIGEYMSTDENVIIKIEATEITLTINGETTTYEAANVTFERVEEEKYYDFIVGVDGDYEFCFTDSEEIYIWIDLEQVYLYQF